MDLSAMWAKAQGKRELPKPYDAMLPSIEDAGKGYIDGYTADQMRDFATPDPAALQRFAEAVAEECAESCRLVMLAHGGDPSGQLVSRDEETLWRQMQAAGASQCIAAIRRHVKGE